MGDKARDYKRTTLRRLDTLSGNQCAAPNCEKSLIAEDQQSIISKICHIEAASKNGPRWNPNMTDDDRRHYDNLILLCDEHHTIIDNKQNESQYTVPLLKEWKANHESKMLYRLKNSSLLKTAIYAIADLEIDEAESVDQNLGAFDIKAKIEYNQIRRNRSIIEEYKAFYTKVNSIYGELENQGSFKKEKLLRNVRHIYLKNKDDSNNYSADEIYENIESELYDRVKDDGDFYQEDIIWGISIIMVDAFMRCKIMEKPM